jgi:hypothetical protein
MRLESQDLPKFKSPSAFITFNSGEREGKCGHWGEVDRFGYCLDEDCRHNRLVAALHRGDAKMLPNGTLVWNVEK